MSAETGALIAGMIPAEFQDRLADEFLLAPDFDYFWAKCAYSTALAAQLMEMPGFDLQMLQFKEGRLGAQGMLANLTEAMSAGMGGPLVLSSMVYPDFIKIVTDPSKDQTGEVIKINRPRFIDGVATEAAHRIGPQTPFFSSTGQTPTMDQVDVSIFEAAGPTDANGNLAPINLASFTKRMSKHDLLTYVGMLLRRDRWRYVNYLIETRLLNAADATSDSTGVTRPQGVSASTDYTAAGAEPFTMDLIFSAEEALKHRKAPGIQAGARYVALLDIHQTTQLQNDPAYQRNSRYFPEMNVLFPGYVRNVNNTVVCESNAVTRLSNLGVGANITGYQGIVVAPEVLGWGSASPAQPIRDRNDDGGRFNRFGWGHCYEGWQILQNDFVQKIITD